MTTLIVTFVTLCLISVITGTNSESSNNGTLTMERTNVLGTLLEICSLDPVTGWFR